VLRLLFGIILIYFGFRINGALGAIFLSILVAIIITFVPIKGLFLKSKGGGNPVSTKEILSYGFPVMVATLFFMMLTYVDMILVKHYFAPEDAGIYATAEVLGKIVIYLPVSIVLALFPLVAESHALNQDSFHMLDKGLLYTGVISATTAFIFFLFPELSISTLFGNKYLAAAPLLRLFSLAMVPLALINIIMYFNLARDRTAFIYSFIGFSILEVILIALFHGSLSHVLFILIGVLTTLFVINLGIVSIDRRSTKEKKHVL
jgi:O-antigen/teichoic acid export membrane protein